jgi:uncharacterized protein YjbI with pentapeptide repeats
MKHQIKHRYTDAVLFQCDVTDDMGSKFRTRHALEKAVEAHANLADANLAHANLADAYLAGANLAGANLVHANLVDAYLAGAYLAGANLAGANLAGAYLAGAYLAHANLADAYLADANLAHAKWSGGITINRAPLQLNGLHWMVYILDDHMQIGCELHTLAEWAAFDDSRIVEMDGKDALRFWRNHKASLLALAASDGRGMKVEQAEAK